MDFCPAFWDWLAEQNGGGPRLQHREGRATSLRAGEMSLQAGPPPVAQAFFLPTR